MVSVKYEDLVTAFDFVSFGSLIEREAYILLETGAIYWISEDGSADEPIPEDLETSERYLAIPHKNDLDLGTDLALRFAARELPGQYARIQEFFHHRGAYARFKEVLAAAGRLDDWYRFEAEATEKALKEWCADNGIHIIDPESSA